MGLVVLVLAGDVVALEGGEGMVDVLLGEERLMGPVGGVLDGHPAVAVGARRGLLEDVCGGEDGGGNDGDDDDDEGGWRGRQGREERARTRYELLLLLRSIYTLTH